MRPTIVSLRRQFVWLVVVLAVIGVLRLLAGQYLLSRFQERTAGVADGHQANQAMLQAMTDAETGVRGYQLTGETVFLEPYARGTAAYPAALRNALAVAPSEQVRERLSEQDTAAQQWIREFAAPSAAVPAGRPGVQAQHSLRGKTLFDAYRAANTSTAEALSSRQRLAVSHFRTAGNIMEGVLAGLALVSVLAAVRLSVRTHRLLLTPLSRLQDTLGRLAGGDRAARAEPDGPPEVHILAETLNRALDQQRDTENRLRQARDDLAAQQTYLTEILDSITVAVLTCHADGTLREVNRAARAAHGGAVPEHAADLHGVAEPGTDPATAPHPLLRALHGDILTRADMTVRGPDGADVAVLVDARPLHDPDGTITGALATGYNVNALREREAELTAFAGVVAHDLRAPLTAVAGFAEILDDDLVNGSSDPTTLRATLARIRGGVDRMRRLIDDLLAYATARDAPLHLQPVDLHPIVEEIITERTAHLDGRAAGAADADPLPRITVSDLPTVHADQAMIRQVLDNLIGNALKYTHADQPADITITATTATTATGGTARIDIADRGIGIPPDQRTRVFTSFHRAHSGQGFTGTGLGLAICQRIVHRHGGDITIDDNPAGGTLIHLTLPQHTTTPTGPPTLALR